MLIDFHTLDGLRRALFQGFVSVGDLRRLGLGQVPELPGVYCVLRASRQLPRFRRMSSAGWFKGRDPSLSLRELRTAWIADASVLYIGKAGGGKTRSVLRTRIACYLRHGAGARAAHWGGRAIWQLADSSQLLFAWKPEEARDPASAEKLLLDGFNSIYHALPFANRRF